VLRLALEVLAKLGVLGGDADGAGVFLADAHHQAADSDERRGGEAVFLGT
jgi:phage baseplate assembly protein gpV